ncbi:hypothetical protein [Peptoniphilus asaccharolyticus]
MYKEDNEQFRKNMFSLIDSVKIPIIDNATNFWLVRTEGGILYETFKNNNFIALRFNEISKEDIDAAKENEEKEKELKNRIKNLYNTNQPGTIYNKVDKFTNIMKTNDIAMIPSESNKELLFALVGDFYTENDIKITEAEFLEQKKLGFGEIFETMECPYIKRRKILPIKVIKYTDYVNPRIYKSLTSYHGLSNINDYAEEVLSTIFPLFIYANKVNMVFQIQNEKGIDAEAYSSLIYNTSKILNQFGKPTIKTNVNSPGDITISIPGAFNYLKDTIPVAIVLMIFICGGEFGKLKVNGLLDKVLEIFKVKADSNLKNAEAKLKEAEAHEKHADSEIKEAKAENQRILNAQLKLKYLNINSEKIISENQYQLNENRFLELIESKEELEINEDFFKSSINKNKKSDE